MRAHARRLTAIAIAIGLLATGAGATVAAAATEPGRAAIGTFEAATERWDLFANGGAEASWTRESDDPAEGAFAARIVTAISSGTAELARATGRIDATAVAFAVRSAEIDDIAVRLRDSSGQTHQQRIALDPLADGWQTIRIDDFAGGRSNVHWGGANDGVWHGPLVGFSIVLDAYAYRDGLSDGTLDLDAVVATVPVPGLVVFPVRLGNAFDAGEQVEIGVAGDVAEVSWTVRDGHGTVVDEGSTATASLGGRLPLALESPGWYAVEVVGVGADGTRHTAGTDLSVTTPLPPAALDPRLGVSTHFVSSSWPIEQIPLIARAGFGLARDEAYWAQQETVPGEFVWQERVRQYQAAFEHEGIGRMHILSYGNPLYFEDEAPSTPEGREAFARYAVESVREFGEDAVYEIWNEWNWRDLDGAAGGSAEQYYELVRVVHDAVTAEFPDATLIGPALAPMNDWEGWFREFAELGGLDYLDGVSTHPYTFPQRPEDSARFGGHYATLRGILAEHDAAELPMYLSEVGWPTSSGSQGVSEAAQARYLVRAELLAFADGIAEFTIYDFMDDGLDASDNEDRFGIVRNVDDPRGSYVPKPAYVANAVLARALQGLPSRGTVELGDSAWDVVFGEEGSPDVVHAAWAATPATAAVAATGAVRVTDLYGASLELTPDAEGLVHVSLGEDPVYLSGRITDVELAPVYRLEVDDEISGTPTAGRVLVDNSAGSAPLRLAVTGGAAATTVDAGASGVLSVTFPAQESAGSRVYSVVVERDGAAVAALSASGTPRPALSLAGSHAVTAEGEHVLRLRVENASGAPLVLDGVDWTRGDEEGVVLAGETVPAGGGLTADVPAAVAEPTAWRAVLHPADAAPVTAAGTVRPAAEPIAVPAQSVDVDGVLDPAIEVLAPIELAATGAPAIPGWGGEGDLSGDLWLTQDADRLYLSARIVDDVHTQTDTGAEIWRGDGLQIGLTAGAPGEAVRVQELGAALTPDGPRLHRWAPVDEAATPGGTVRIARDEASATTVYELEIPWTELGFPPEDRLLSATVVVNENDGSGREGWLSWGLGVAEAKAPAGFNALLLDPETAPPSPQDGISLRTSVRAQCWGDEAVVAVHVVNTASGPTDVRVSTPWGEEKFTAVAPGTGAYHGFTTGVAGVAEGEVTVAAYRWRDGDPVYERSVHPFTAVSCP